MTAYFWIGLAIVGASSLAAKRLGMNRYKELLDAGQPMTAEVVLFLGFALGILLWPLVLVAALAAMSTKKTPRR